MFHKICMSKRKNLDPWEGGAPAAPPWIRQCVCPQMGDIGKHNYFGNIIDDFNNISIIACLVIMLFCVVYFQSSPGNGGKSPSKLPQFYASAGMLPPPPPPPVARPVAIKTTDGETVATSVITESQGQGQLNFLQVANSLEFTRMYPLLCSSPSHQNTLQPNLFCLCSTSPFHSLHPTITSQSLSPRHPIVPTVSYDII